MSLTARMDDEVVLGDAVEKASRGTYKCINCGEDVYVKKGLIRVHHFAHYPDVNTSKCVWWEHESYEHMYMKYYMYKVLENGFPNVVSVNKPDAIVVGNLRPDIYFSLDINGTVYDVALECQYSPKAFEDTLLKTSKYTELGILTMWVWHKRISMNRFFISDGSLWYCYVFDTDVEEKNFKFEVIKYPKQHVKGSDTRIYYDKPFVCKSNVRGRTIRQLGFKTEDNYGLSWYDIASKVYGESETDDNEEEWWWL